VQLPGTRRLSQTPTHASTHTPPSVPAPADVRIDGLTGLEGATDEGGEDLTARVLRAGADPVTHDTIWPANSPAEMRRFQRRPLGSPFTGLAACAS
jgi:hypothetical protein